MQPQLAEVIAHLQALTPAEQTVGAHIDVSHEAATPAGPEVTATVKLVAVEGQGKAPSA